MRAEGRVLADRQLLAELEGWAEATVAKVTGLAAEVSEKYEKLQKELKLLSKAAPKAEGAARGKEAD